MSNRLCRVALDHGLWGDGSVDDASSSDYGSVRDGHVREDNHSRANVDIVLNPNRGSITRSRLFGGAPEMGDDYAANANGDVRTDGYELGKSRFDDDSDADERMVADSDSALAMQPDARGRGAWYIECESLKDSVPEPDPEGVLDGSRDSRPSPHS